MGLCAISVDAAADSQKLTQRLSLTFPLLSDPDMRVIKAYGVAMKGQDIAVPATFIIRRDRQIAWRHVGETQADRPSAAALLTKARSLR